MIPIFLGKDLGFIPSWGSTLHFSCHIVPNGTFCPDWTPAYPDFDVGSEHFSVLALDLQSIVVLISVHVNALLQNYLTTCFKSWFSFCCPWSVAQPEFSWFLLSPPVLCPCDPWHHTWWHPEPCSKDQYFIIYKSFLDKDFGLAPSCGSTLLLGGTAGA